MRALGSIACACQQPCKFCARARNYFGFIRAYVEERCIKMGVVRPLQEVAAIDIHLDNQSVGCFCAHSNDTALDTYAVSTVRIFVIESVSIKSAFWNFRPSGATLGNKIPELFKIADTTGKTAAHANNSNWG